VYIYIVHRFISCNYSTQYNPVTRTEASTLLRTPVLVWPAWDLRTIYSGRSELFADLGLRSRCRKRNWI